MSGTGTYVAQAGTNLLHTFTPTPSYWIAAGTNVTLGSVLSIDTITQTREAKFPSNFFNLVGVLQEDNTWDVKSA
ncbi:protein rhiA, partial [Rhizobium ruizarguesonis]